MNHLPTSDDQMAAHVGTRLAEAQQLVGFGKRSDALAVLRGMLPLKATGAFWGAVAQQLFQLSDLAGAEKAARNFQKGCPGDEKAALGLSMILADAGKLREALSFAQRALTLQPDDPVAHYCMGLILSRENKIKSALKHFQKAVEIRPDHSDALEYIAYLSKGAPEQGDLRAIDDALASNVHAGRPGEAALWYARAAWLERGGDFDDAFSAYEEGARLMRAQSSFGITALERYVDRLKLSFSESFFTASQKHAYPNKSPIFIVGVPRSGTTLVETSIAAHSKVSSAGETTLVSLATMPYGSFEPVDLARINAELERGGNPWSEMGLVLKKSYADRVGRNRRVTEKNLGNHFLLGAIAMIASRAPIIYCVRDPAATAWSSFKTRFRTGNEWSYDFDSIVRYQELYGELMKHWQETLPGNPIFEVRYEDLVSRPEEVIPAVLSHAGLKFESRCLSPHEASLPVMTASMAEVRQPIHTASISGWRRYESQLIERHPVFETAENCP
ncbi:MAG: sulfotransferase [Gammaproteobacteria bacterium]|nr:sulfotransferase [Gammaproteobacteria bacterium]